MAPLRFALAALLALTTSPAFAAERADGPVAPAATAQPASGGPLRCRPAHSGREAELKKDIATLDTIVANYETKLAVLTAERAPLLRAEKANAAQAAKLADLNAQIALTEKNRDAAAAKRAKLQAELNALLALPPC